MIRRSQTHPGPPGLRRPLALVAALGAVLAGLGCASKGDQAAEPFIEDLALTLKLDRSVYRPGEAVVATVKLKNQSSRKMLLRDLDGVNGQSCSFWFYEASDALTSLMRLPVRSLKEEPGKTTEVEPGESLERRFLLARLTEFSGPMRAQVHYNPNPPFTQFDPDAAASKVFSNTVNFEVRGERLFERDSAGIILKEEAIGLAHAVAPGEVLAGEAIIFEDEKGFHKWYVNLRVRNGEEGGKVVAWFVDPYVGRVMDLKVKPFPPEMARDNRFTEPMKRKGTR